MNKKVVVLGGGTGLSALLRGIKYIKGIDISAIVTVADSGGSTGVLSHHFNIPAVGDLRRVIAALSHHREELEESMEYRIKGTKTDLDGHTIGNLILVSQIQLKKDFALGIEAATKMLNVSGSIIPVSNRFNDLYAELEDGNIVKSEVSIGHSTGKIKRLFYKSGIASHQAIEAINNADYIIFGIGSLFTSLIANIVYPKIKEALINAKAKKIYFANVFTQHGETDDFSLQDHIDAIENHTAKGIIDEVIVSNSKILPEVLKTYEKDKQFLVKNDYGKAIKHDLVSEIFNEKTKVYDAKHDDAKIKKVMELLIK